MTTATFIAPFPGTRDHAERVANGVALLDAFGPEGWREQIDVDRLDLPQFDSCILAHVYGSYYAGLDDLAYRLGDSVGTLDLEAHTYGFGGAGTNQEDYITQEHWVCYLQAG